MTTVVVCPRQYSNKKKSMTTMNYIKKKNKTKSKIQSNFTQSTVSILRLGDFKNSNEIEKIKIIITLQRTVKLM